MYFPSKKDWWLGVILWGSALTPLVIYIFPTPKNSLSLFIGIILMIFIGWLWFKTGYTINDKELITQSGPFRSKIPLRSIRKVSHTRNPLSSPALSLDRLDIKYSNGFILISPSDKDAFFTSIKRTLSQHRD